MDLNAAIIAGLDLPDENPPIGFTFPNIDKRISDLPTNMLDALGTDGNILLDSIQDNQDAARGKLFFVFDRQGTYYTEDNFNAAKNIKSNTIYKCNDASNNPLEGGDALFKLNTANGTSIYCKKKEINAIALNPNSVNNIYTFEATIDRTGRTLSKEYLINRTAGSVFEQAYAQSLAAARRNGTEEPNGAAVGADHCAVVRSDIIHTIQKVNIVEPVRLAIPDSDSKVPDIDPDNPFSPGPPSASSSILGLFPPGAFARSRAAIAAAAAAAAAGVPPPAVSPELTAALQRLGELQERIDQLEGAPAAASAAEMAELQERMREARRLVETWSAAVVANQRRFQDEVTQLTLRARRAHARAAVAHGAAASALRATAERADQEVAEARARADAAEEQVGQASAAAQRAEEMATRAARAVPAAAAVAVVAPTLGTTPEAIAASLARPAIVRAVRAPGHPRAMPALANF